MNNLQIEAIGNFLMYYQKDLEYIKMFQDFKKGNIADSEYIKKDKGSFYAFLIEFNVIRNLIKGSGERLLTETATFINSISSDNVDYFAESIAATGISRGNTTTSLASKVLFLNNPWKILPMDSRARQAFHQSENKYSIFITNIEKFKLSNQNFIKECLSFVEPLAVSVERDYQNSLVALEKIRENRMIDKILWTTNIYGS